MSDTYLLQNIDSKYIERVVSLSLQKLRLNNLVGLAEWLGTQF